MLPVACRNRIDFHIRMRKYGFDMRQREEENAKLKRIRIVADLSLNKAICRVLT